MYELQTVSVKNRGKYTCTLYMVIQIKTRAIRYDEFFPSLVLNNLIIWGSVRKNLLIEYKKNPEQSIGIIINIFIGGKI